MVSLGGRIAASLLAGALGGACAAHRTAAVPRQPELEPPAPSLQQYITDVRGAAAAARPRSERALILEKTDPSLMELRARLLLEPTAFNYRLVADAYVSRGVLDAAYDHFTAALKVSPRDSAAFAGRARVWRDWGAPQLGLADAHRAIFHAPDSAPAHNTLGTILLKLGLPREATVAFERTMALDARAGYALNNLCYVRLLEGKHQQAIDLCATALTMTPELSAARNNLALAYAASGDFDRASSEFSQSNTAGAASFNMGVAFLATGRFADAATAFERSAQQRPAFGEARRRATAARVRATRSEAGSRVRIR